jgi:hypothetical protein
MFKGLNIVSDEVLSDFRRLPDKLTFAQGVQILKTEKENWHTSTSRIQTKPGTIKATDQKLTGHTRG